MPTPHIIHGDCLDKLREVPDASIDSVITDPPYGLSALTPDQVADVIGKWASGHRDAMPTGRGFMGKTWDVFVPPPAVWDECLRVLKPGGHMIAFAGSRTQDLMGLSIRLSGFDIRDSLAWIYGSGLPKSMDVSKAIDKAHGEIRTSATPITDAAKQWDGWGTALKPAIEPIILARKPLEGTVAHNVTTHGVGGLNIAASRVGDITRPVTISTGKPTKSSKSGIFGQKQQTKVVGETTGRFPPNVILDDHTAHHLGDRGDYFPRFNYQPKAPKSERPVITREDGTSLHHPTVKPLAIMEWLITMITPPGGTILDPFAGSGTTLQAATRKNFRSIGIERDADYVNLITKRCT
ncbi:DNA-methyltransferase [Corynebacterium glutamicum]|uniref:DNA-methyltransferase n=1 Tax=Corynebacterium glutamicum TaxID=1718 RepID=UPI0009423CB4|nr:site-specific DNA-methyltransferase [Corynebacterium glutamicum]OKX85141.1 hypothetical protein AUO95_00990 [Corynebacterium glutamicum]